MSGAGIPRWSHVRLLACVALPPFGRTFGLTVGLSLILRSTPSVGITGMRGMPEQGREVKRENGKGLLAGGPAPGLAGVDESGAPARSATESRSAMCQLRREFQGQIHTGALWVSGAGRDCRRCRCYPPGCESHRTRRPGTWQVRMEVSTSNESGQGATLSSPAWTLRWQFEQRTQHFSISSRMFCLLLKCLSISLI